MARALRRRPCGPGYCRVSVFRARTRPRWLAARLLALAIALGLGVANEAVGILRPVAAR